MGGARRRALFGESEKTKTTVITIMLKKKPSKMCADTGKKYCCPKPKVLRIVDNHDARADSDELLSLTFHLLTRNWITIIMGFFSAAAERAHLLVIRLNNNYIHSLLLQTILRVIC